MLDLTDLKIVFILQNDGRKRLADIAEEVDLSAPAVMERVKKLEASGVSVGNQRDIDKFAGQMMRYADVLECHHVTGEESFVLKVKSANTAALEKLLGQIRSVEGVTRTVTKVVLSTAKEGMTVDLDACTVENPQKKKIG